MKGVVDAMARTKTRKPSVNWRSVNSRLDQIDALMQDVYKGTYRVDASNSTNLQNITDDIMGSIDALIANDTNINGIPNISRLYNRIQSKSDTLGEFSAQEFMDVFNDKTMISNLMDVYAKSKTIRQMDEQIDMVCKYMPKLQDALEIKKDSVLVSETFSKDYLNLISGLNRDDKDFSSRITALKDKYDLEDFIDTMDMNTSKYGECFVYRVPYKKAFKTILDKRAKSPRAGMAAQSLYHQECSIITEGVWEASPGSLRADSSAPMIEGKSNFKVNLFVGLQEQFSRTSKADEIKRRLPTSLYEQMLEENAALNEAVDTSSVETKEKNGKVQFKQLIPDELSYDPLDASASDGFTDKDKKKDKGTNVTAPGCVLKMLPRDKVFPIYIEDSCIGYYYIEYVNPTMENGSMFMGSMLNSNKKKQQQALDNTENEDKILRYLASKIASQVDASFINTNTDLTKEIYMILKYDEKFNINDMQGQMNISFIPAEDIHHHYYRMDPVTHRGISDLYDGLIPATIWCMLSLCTAVGIVTRGTDKRVYYVQQTGVETNVAKTLMNVVNQIKKGNFGVRQLESINNILGIVGKFNDFVIPTGPNGEAPVRFELMQGQNIETPTELMNQMEENAINPTGVPIELINATKGLDYAVHYTVSNSRFMSIIMKRQGKEQRMQGSLITTIYNCEYDENTVIKVMLPAPKFMTMANSNSVVDNTKVYVQNLTEVFCYDMNDTEKAEFTNLAMRHFLSSHVDTNAIDELKSLARINVAAKGNEEQQ